MKTGERWRCASVHNSTSPWSSKSLLLQNEVQAGVDDGDVGYDVDDCGDVSYDVVIVDGSWS